MAGEVQFYKLDAALFSSSSSGGKIGWRVGGSVDKMSGARLGGSSGVGDA